MKKILLSAAALVASTAIAASADLPMRAAPFVGVPVFTWTGGYIGLNLGVSFDDRRNDRGGPSTLSFPVGAGGPGSDFLAGAPGVAGTPGVPFGPAVAPLAGVPLPAATVLGLNSACVNCGNGRGTNLLFGAQAGFNYQFTPGSGFVLGAEVDIQHTGWGRSDVTTPVINGTTVTTPAFVGAFGLFGSTPAVQAGPNTFTFFDPRAAARHQPEWFGTARLRAGYAIDRLLLYVTGGAAFSEGTNLGTTVQVITHTGSAVVPSGLCRFGCDSMRVGWTLGGGVEYALTDRWTIKAEGLYARFDHQNDQASGNLTYGVATGPGFAGGLQFTAPAGAFSPRASRRDDGFLILRTGVNLRFSGL